VGRWVDGYSLVCAAQGDPAQPRGPAVGVRNSDHALDLRIRCGRRRRASDSKEAREASVRHSIRLPWRAELPECGAVQDLSPSDADLSQIGWRRGSHSGFREGDSRRSDRRPDQAKPQVTRVIGVFDPYSLVDCPSGPHGYAASCEGGPREPPERLLRLWRLSLLQREYVLRIPLQLARRVPHALPVRKPVLVHLRRRKPLQVL
jgi:hypothetical protein